MGRNKNQKHVVPTKSKLKKDPGVPKLPDLKQKKSEEKRRSTQSLHPVIKDADAVMASEPTLSTLAQLAEASSSALDDLPQDPSSSTSATKAQARKHYIRILHKVIDEADVIVLVLDARDPEGCRSRLVEEEVRRREAEGKKLVFVLNKIDLVPRSNAEAWLRYLRHTTPTLPFRSSTQQQRTNLASRTSPALLNLLKSYKPGARSVTVGIVGYPNVGKSSLINSLKRAKVCAVAAEAGHTKEMQSIQIERGIRVLDSPGVLFDDDEQESNNLLLRNVVKVENIDDPIAVVEQILVRTGEESIRKIYRLPEFKNVIEFMTMLALSNGRLLKGGTPDILAAARQVIQDWNMQKIPYFSEPPNVHPSSMPATISAETSAKYGLEGNVAPGAENVGHAEIVTQFAPAFDLGGLFGQADQGAFEDADMQVSEDNGEVVQEVEMTSNELTSSLSRKRPRSPDPVDSNAMSLDNTPSAHTPFSTTQPDAPEHSPKRAKVAKKEEFTYDTSAHLRATAGLASMNPMNRRAQKKEAKRARKVERKKMRDVRGGMEVDDEDASVGLGFTFMANPDGVLAI